MGGATELHGKSQGIYFGLHPVGVAEWFSAKIIAGRCPSLIR